MGKFCLLKLINGCLSSIYRHYSTATRTIQYPSSKPPREILIGGFVQSGDLDKALKVFDEMPNRNIATWNAMITGLTDFEYNEEALRLLSEMHVSGFYPDEFTLGSVLQGCAGLKSLSAGQQVHAYAVKSGVEVNVVVGSSLALMYMKSGGVAEGEKVIKAMPVHSVAVCNKLISGRAQSRYPEEALNLYYIMKKAGFIPDEITFATVLSVCSELATLGQGQQIHAEAIKSGDLASFSVTRSLANMYSNCGCLDRPALDVVVESSISHLVCWTSVHAGFGLHGMGGSAFCLFDWMQNRKHDMTEVTFLSLLYACRNCGIKDVGIKVFDYMVYEYGLQPQLPHYTCLVEILGRSGRLEEAEAVVRSMPMKADSIIWKTLLSACSIYENADMAKRIAEEVIRVDPQDPASNVLLAKIAASAKPWHNVSDLMKPMRGRNVKKELDVSWFETKNQVHQFCMNDKSHPDFKTINLYFKKLRTKMKLLGYKPRTGSISVDMNLEEKEDDLVHHSEILAIVFALMNTRARVPIRVMKDLQVCNDCHVAIKYISALMHRKIIVRDASGFHYFHQGKCSCEDLWY